MRPRTKRTEYLTTFACEFCGTVVTKIVRSPKIVRRFCSPRCRNTVTNRKPENRARAAAMAKARGAPNKSHGESLNRSAEYDAWRSMKRRCEPSNKRAAPYYADRGIKVCERWASSFESFLADVGRKPGPEYSLDRIDNSGGYEPSNVRWATWSEQMRNRRKPSEWPSAQGS